MVAPQMSKNWLDDPECVDGLHEKIETHLLRDVIPTVDQQLRTERTRTGRIFAGMSAGGYCALNLGLRHPNLTATVLDLSGFTVPTHSGGMTSLFGRDNAAAVEQNSPASYAGKLAGSPPMRIWLDCGSSDRGVLRQLDAISGTLRRDGMVVEQHSRPGDHSYSVWRPALKESLTWALSDRSSTGQPAANHNPVGPGLIESPIGVYLRVHHEPTSGVSCDQATCQPSRHRPRSTGAAAGPPSIAGRRADRRPAAAAGL